MNVTTDRTNLIEIKNHNIHKNILLNSSSIVFKNKLLEQKKYHSNTDDQNILETNDENNNYDNNFSSKQNRFDLLMEKIDIIKYIKQTPSGLKLMKILQE